MAKQQPTREKKQKADPDADQNQDEEEVARYEQELAGYLQERIKPGLNSGAIPLLARSIAKEIAHGERRHAASDGAGLKPEPESQAPPDFEDDMHELQAELGEEWILRFSVQGDDAWLTAEKADGSQHVEAPTAAVLAEAVELLNEGGGRSS
jgi:hypothetical protein